MQRAFSSQVMTLGDPVRRRDNECRGERSMGASHGYLSPKGPARFRRQ